MIRKIQVVSWNPGGESSHSLETEPSRNRLITVPPSFTSVLRCGSALFSSFWQDQLSLLYGSPRRYSHPTKSVLRSLVGPAARRDQLVPIPSSWRENLIGPAALTLRLINCGQGQRLPSRNEHRPGPHLWGWGSWGAWGVRCASPAHYATTGKITASGSNKFSIKRSHWWHL